MNADVTDVMLRLADPFNADEVQFKPQSTNGNRVLAIAYIDSRAVMDRLDEVLGIAGWQDEYRPLENGAVECCLRCRIDGEWIAKVDVGGPSDQRDAGDQRKAAYSDALKRAAVKFGIGRYLYHLPKVWVAYDPDKKQMTETPKLPAWALPSPVKPAATGQKKAALINVNLLKTIHAKLAVKKRPWESALKYVGVKMPARWEEPSSDEDLVRVADILTPQLVMDLAATLKIEVNEHGEPIPF